MAKLEKRLLENCKEAVNDFETGKFTSLLSSFEDRQKTAQQTEDKDLELLMKLLWGVFSMYFQFAKGQPFGPIWQSPNGRRTMMPQDLQEDELCKLEEILQISHNPEFVVRICDVLWIRRRNYLYAKKAIDAYLQSIDQDKSESWVAKSKWLKRAVQIAMELGEKAQERHVVKNKLMNLFEESRKNCFNPEFRYWPHALLELLIENRLVDNWEELGDKATEIAKGFSTPSGYEERRKYLSLATKCYDLGNKPEKAKEAKLAIAKYYEDEARSFKTPNGCDGFNMAFRLEKAIQAYRDVGEKEKAEELIPELKEANKIAVSQMKSISTEIDIMPLVKIANDFLEGKNGMDMITAFASLYNPLSYDEAERSAKELIQKYPMQGIFSKSVLTSEGNVSEKIPGMFDDENERIKADIIGRYNLSQNLVASTTLRQGISMVLKSDGTWRDAIRELVKISGFVPKDRTDIYERAIIAGFEGDLLVFINLIVPQLENSVRSIFAKNSLKITSVLPSGVQREKDLNELLYDVNAEKIFGKDLLWEMRSLLIEQSGPNLRNRICHGLMNSKEINNSASIFLLWLTVYFIISFK